MGKAASDMDTQLSQALSAKALAPLGAAAGQDLLAVLGRHAQPKAVAACAHEAGGLECALHEESSGSKIERRWIVDGAWTVNNRCPCRGL